MDTLSKYLADQIAFIDEDAKAEELAASATDRERLLESVENLYRHPEPTVFTMYAVLRKAANKRTVGDPAVWQSMTKHLLDDCFSRLMIDEIPRIVSRAMSLEPMVLGDATKADENPYLREATRCFLFGLFNASVSLSGSALEESLSRSISNVLHGNGREDKLRTLIVTARNSLLKRTPHVCDLADEVRKRANSIVHGRVAHESETMEILRNTRTIVHALYAQTKAG